MSVSQCSTALADLKLPGRDSSERSTSLPEAVLLFSVTSTVPLQDASASQAQLRSRANMAKLIEVNAAVTLNAGETRFLTMC